MTSERVLALQRTVGNAAVGRYLSGGQPDEPRETGRSVSSAIGASEIRTRTGARYASGGWRLSRRVDPEDVAVEMVGAGFTVTAAFPAGPVAKGERVEVIAWDNAKTTATVKSIPPNKNAGKPFEIPKKLLRPIRPAVSGVDPYSAGVDAAAQGHERGEAKIEQEKSRKGGPRPGEIPRLEGLQQQRAALLNKRLIQETMVNRFDPEIKKWVDHYNASLGSAGAKALDPNLVKSMLFQESQMGTSGEHLEESPSHPVRSRFNLAQVIDSSAAALLIMIREEEPALIAKYHLVNISKDLDAAKHELEGLRKVAHPTLAQTARIAELEALSAGSWESFLWGYRAAGESVGFYGAATDFFDLAAGTDRDVDYGFWIQVAVRWLFEKRKGVKSWEEAVRAYNGSGARAKHYRDAVKTRATEARAAAKKGGAVVPAGL